MKGLKAPKPAPIRQRFDRSEVMRVADDLRAILESDIIGLEVQGLGPKTSELPGVTVKVTSRKARPVFGDKSSTRAPVATALDRLQESGDFVPVVVGTKQVWDDAKRVGTWKGRYPLTVHIVRPELEGLTP